MTCGTEAPAFPPLASLLDVRALPSISCIREPLDWRRYLAIVAQEVDLAVRRECFADAVGVGARVGNDLVLEIEDDNFRNIGCRVGVLGRKVAHCRGRCGCGGAEWR